MVGGPRVPLPDSRTCALALSLWGGKRGPNIKPPQASGVESPPIHAPNSPSSASDIRHVYLNSVLIVPPTPTHPPTTTPTSEPKGQQFTPSLRVLPTTVALLPPPAPPLLLPVPRQEYRAVPVLYTFVQAVLSARNYLPLITTLPS